MDELLTIVVPVYKIREDYLREGIEGLLQQTDQRFVVYLVDDGSPDHCGAICDEYAAGYPHVFAIHQENQGVSVARNTGLNQTKTPWVLFLDPDDWTEANLTQSVLSVLEHQAKEADILMFCYAREYEEKCQVERLSCGTGYLSDEMLKACRLAPFFKLYDQGTVNPYSINAVWNKVYRTQFLRDHRIHFLPEARKGQDRLFNAEAVNATEQIYYLDLSLYHYRCYQESVTNKYNPNIVKLTYLELGYLNQLIADGRVPEEFRNFFYCRVCTRLYSCMRLYLYHHDAPLTPGERRKALQEILDHPLFAEAFRHLNWSYLDRTERLYLFLVKHEMFALCGLLTRVKAYLKWKK